MTFACRLASFAALFCLGLPVWAQPREADADALFERLDRDRDGYLFIAAVHNEQVVLTLQSGDSAVRAGRATS